MQWTIKDFILAIMIERMFINEECLKEKEGGR